MPIIIKKSDRKDFTKVVCPACAERVKGVGLLKDSRIDGLTFKCNRCNSTWVITTE
jgi:transposase-like protein